MSDTRPRFRPLRWLLIAAGLVFLGFAVTNPGRQAHLAALGNPTHTRYDDYMVYSTTKTIDLAGDERQTSMGVLGTVYVE